MTGILIRRGRFGDTLAHTQGRWSSDDVGGNWSDVAKTQGIVRHGCRHQSWILDSRTSWAFGTLISPGSPPATFSGPSYSVALPALLLLTSNGWSPQAPSGLHPLSLPPGDLVIPLSLNPIDALSTPNLTSPCQAPSFSFLLECTKAGLMASPSSNAQDATRPHPPSFFI